MIRIILLAFTQTIYKYYGGVKMLSDIFNTDHIVVGGYNTILPEVNKGSKTSVNYDGILAEHNADKIYLHYGFDGWNKVNTIQMNKGSEGTFSTEIKVNGKNELNFCFKDSANNWDNNNGSDWTVGISHY